MAIRTKLHCVWQASWQNALMETLMATSLCIGVLGTFFGPHEYTRATAVAATRTLNCWPLQDGQAVAALVESVAVHVDSMPRERSVQWHTGNSPCVLPRPLRLSKDASCLAFDPRGERMFVGFSNGLLQGFLIDDAETETAVLGHVAGLTEVVCSPNGESLLTAGDRGLELWDVPSRGLAVLQTSRVLANGRIDCLAVSPCSRAVLAGITTAEGSRLIEIDLRCGTAMPLMELPERQSRVLISADGKQLAAIHDTGEILFCERASCESSWQRVEFPGLRTVAVLLASFSPDSSLFITSDRFGSSLLVWDLYTKTVRRSLDSPTSFLQGCAFLDPTHVITWGFNQNLNDDSLFLQDDVQVIEL